MAVRDAVSAEEMEGVGTVVRDSVSSADSVTVGLAVLLTESCDETETLPLGNAAALLEGNKEELVFGEGDAIAVTLETKEGVSGSDPLAECEGTLDMLLEALLDRVEEEEPELETADEKETLTVPLCEGLSITLRVIEPETQEEGEAVLKTEVVRRGLPVDAPLEVRNTADPLTLAVLLRLPVPQDEYDALSVEVTLPLSLKEQLPLAVFDTVPVILDEVEKEFEPVLVK